MFFEITFHSIVAFLFYNGFSVLSALCLLYSDYFRFNDQFFKGHMEKSKRLPFQMLAAWVLFSLVFYFFHPTCHVHWRQISLEMRILCLSNSTEVWHAADWSHLRQCQKLASHPRKILNCYFYSNTRILNHGFFSKYLLRFDRFSLHR